MRAASSVDTQAPMSSTKRETQELRSTTSRLHSSPLLLGTSFVPHGAASQTKPVGQPTPPPGVTAATLGASYTFFDALEHTQLITHPSPSPPPLPPDRPHNLPSTP